jgi:hypothetical protein
LNLTSLSVFIAHAIAKQLLQAMRQYQQAVADAIDVYDQIQAEEDAETARLDHLEQSANVMSLDDPCLLQQLDAFH